MSRSGYDDGCDDGWAMIRYRGAVKSAIRGRRGQAFLRDLLATLDAMPEKKLIEGELETPDGVCALGALGRARGIEMKGLDPEDAEHVAAVFGVAPALAREIVYENDEVGYWPKETPEARFTRLRAWVASCLWEPTEAAQ
jgi:hypothetical protein